MDASNHLPEIPPIAFNDLAAQQARVAENLAVALEAQA
jgi:hypothetical protein